ncbi:hypothetical protein [Allokutzneria sp. NRRL B-24872]|uniref:hypothetical protein n=1 Tax=Allokutzneria sp. NRRL B-24872 TaxID=1137961 RepID=UPI0011780C75|nr:hypothetical protein [Allokutzneria sp. NRRL B-24872]
MSVHDGRARPVTAESIDQLDPSALDGDGRFRESAGLEDIVHDNTRRAGFAATALAAYAVVTGTHQEKFATITGDLLGDLRHLADTVGVDLDRAYLNGEAHYRDEIRIDDEPDIVRATNEHDELYVELFPGSPAFPALVRDERADNGWVRPRFRRPVAQAVIDWLFTKNASAHRAIRAGFIDGDVLALFESAEVSFEYRADSDGRFAIGSGAWPWFLSVPAVDPADEAAVYVNAQRVVQEGNEDLVTITMDDPDFPDPIFAALLDGERPCGGWYPRFRRPVANAVVAWINIAFRRDPSHGARAYWEDESVMILHPDYIAMDGYRPERIEPDADGCYAIGRDGWLWEKFDTSD